MSEQEQLQSTIVWSSHFHERLMERFGLALSPQQQKEVEDMITGNELFCEIRNKMGIKSTVYGYCVGSQEIMVVCRGNTVVTAYRLSWFEKVDDVWRKKRAKKVSPLKKRELPEDIKEKIKRKKNSLAKQILRDYREEKLNSPYEIF